jgi:hypothetical protein
MSINFITRPLRRRTILTAGLAIGALQIANPFVVKALGEETVKSGSTTRSQAPSRP